MKTRPVRYERKAKTPIKDHPKTLSLGRYSTTVSLTISARFSGLFKRVALCQVQEDRTVGTNSLGHNPGGVLEAVPVRGIPL